jgi:YfiH family protein
MKERCVVPDWPDAPANLRALATTRVGGVSEGPYQGWNLGLHVDDDPARVAENRARLRAMLPGRPAWIAQVHGIAVADAAALHEGAPAVVADASVASAPGVVCAVLTADCLPVLFADLEGRVVGAAHAGWRGLAAGVLGETVRAMRARGAGEITAWLGPAIGRDKFEVGADVLDAFKGEGRDTCFRPYPGRPGKYLADMDALARLMLRDDGVSRVHGGGLCTASREDEFFSYRRDGVTGRQASLVWLA